MKKTIDYISFSIFNLITVAIKSVIFNFIKMKNKIFINIFSNIIDNFFINYFASTFYNGFDFASVLVKTREGRPIYIKGYKDYGVTKGTTNPQIIASVLSLYDSARLTGPTIGGEVKSYSEVDKGVIAGLKSAKEIVLFAKRLFFLKELLVKSLYFSISCLMQKKLY